MSSPSWRVFDINGLVNETIRRKVPYYEFLRVPELSCGVYRLPAGANDLQSPHDEAEVYFVVEGRALVQVDGQEKQVGPGSILYVQATSEHSFAEIQENITLLVFFASGGTE
jgi:mannose-6-phosphate isomerase-like protein (cupin superfamily)